MKNKDCNNKSKLDELRIKIDEIDEKYLETEKRTTNILDKVTKFRKENMFTNKDVEYNKGDKVTIKVSFGHATLAEGE